MISLIRAHIVRATQHGRVTMKRTSHGRDAIQSGRYESQAPGVSPIDRETLEGVMREDVFLAADGKALALDRIEIWAHSRRDGRRA